MGMTNLFAGLGSALYELPKKVVSYVVIEPVSCGNAKSIADSGAGGLNRATAGLSESGIGEYAVGGIDKIETYLRAKEYIMNCDPGWINSKLTPLTDTAQKVVNQAIEYAQAQGREIPEFYYLAL